VMVVACAIVVSVGAGLLPAAMPVRASASFAVQLPGCASFPPDDSLDFRELFQAYVADTSTDLHADILLPVLPADSVQWGGTATQCDTVAARYRAFRMAATGDTVWPLLPVALLRVGSTRWIADPHVGNAEGLREWVILDSTLTVLKIVKTIP